MRKFLLVIFLFCAGLSGMCPPASAAGQAKAQSVRAVHVVLRSLTVADTKRVIDMAVSAGFNTLIVDPRDQVRFKNFPGKVLRNAWSTDAFASVVAYARKQGLEVIPEVKLLTHQGQFFGDARPELMYDKETYNPQKKAVYDLVAAYLEEMITLIHPVAVHIGHDEVQGIYRVKNNPGYAKGMLPAELFYKDVVMLHDFLKERGVATWMWGDMLISKAELPGMATYHLNGAGGYGGEVRKRLPRDIVICDWHYADEQDEFPSVDIFRDEGFRVLGATFRKPQTIRNFSRYAARHGAEGMIATTWFVPGHASDKVVNSWEEMERIIRESGEAFRRDFPDPGK